MKKFMPLAFIMAITIQVTGQQFLDKLQDYSDQVTSEYSKISKDRKKDLDKLADYIFDQWSENKMIQPLFVCTHNSRRSHMAHIWFQTAMYYYGIPNTKSFSGGTEATAMNERAAKALQRAGFEYKVSDQSDNPVYAFMIGKRFPVIEMYSKTFDDPANPSEDFFAVMVCSEADNSCPLVPGADKRFSLPYVDPRYSDNTASEEKTYDERCREIAREMFYVASEVKKQVIKFQETKKES